MRPLVIPARFNGPPGSANGGYAAGALARAARPATGWDGEVTVRLRQPPPLERPLAPTVVDGTVELRDAEKTVAVAYDHGPEAWTDPEPVALATARGAESRYAGARSHPFPTCFSCGPAREAGDGLRIFPGRVDGDRVAATWTPQAGLDGPIGDVDEPVTWAALDCVGAWSSDLEHRPLVLGEVSARVVSPPSLGATYVVVGTHLRTEGRKTWTATALFDEDGSVVGQAEQLWIAVDWARSVS